MSIDGIKKRPPVNQEKYRHSSRNQSEEENQKMTAFKDNFLQNKKKTPRKFLKNFFYFISLSLFIIILSTGLYFVWKISNTGIKISSGSSDKKFSLLQTISDLKPTKHIQLQEEKSGRINVLLLGVAGEGKAGGNLTDTIMIASIDTKKNKVALLSLPRDLYVSVSDENYQTKINAIYKYSLNKDLEIKPLKKTIEKITGLNINYYIVANFSGFEKFIDNIGGINIQVNRDIYDPRYPGPNYSYELFEIKKGFHEMDGATALKYARERHNDPEGDFGRAKRQQQVLQSIKNKVFSSQILFNPFKINSLLTMLGDNIKTNASLGEIKGFLDLLKQVDTQNITNVVVDAWKKDSLLKVSHIFHGNSRAFILIPRIGNYSEIQDLAKNIFDLNILKHRQKKIKEENAKIAIINESNDPNLSRKIQLLLKDKLKFENIKSIKIKAVNKIYRTKIIDLANKQKPFSLDELIKKLPAVLSSISSKDAILSKNNEFENYDFIILLGEDLITTYKYEEDSVDDLKNQ